MHTKSSHPVLSGGCQDVRENPHDASGQQFPRDVSKTAAEQAPGQTR